MSLTLSSYQEEVGSISPNSATASPMMGRAPWTYIVNSAQAIDVNTLLNNVFGTTSAAVSNSGILNRTLPLVHPVWPSFYAESISQIRGIGNPTVTNALGAAVDNAGLQIPQFLLYPSYAITIEFSPRQYSLIDNTQLTKTTRTWYPPVAWSVPPVTENPTSYFFANEWVRYTNFRLLSSPDFVTAKQGTMQFIAQNFSGPFYGLPRTFLQNQLLKFVWYQVPYRYIYSQLSYIRAAIGRINQYSWYFWPKGSLLYLNYNIVNYVPPQLTYDYPFPSPFNNIPQIQQLCDVEFDFLLTNRTLAPADVTAGLPTSDTTIGWQNNWITSGHNLMPHWTDRLFHYIATTKGQISGGAAQNYGAGTPLWLSFPFELLFTDPDAPGNTAFI